MPQLIGRDPVGNFVFRDDEGNERVVGRDQAGQLGVVDSAAPPVGPTVTSTLPTAQGETNTAIQGIQSDAGPTTLPLDQLAFAPSTQSAPPAPTALPTSTTNKTTIHPGLPEKDALTQELSIANDSQAKGVRMAMESGVRKAAQEFGTLSESLSQMQKMQAENMAKQQEHTARLETVRNRLEQQADTLAKSDVDPNRLYRNQDTASQIAAGFAVGLGGLAQGLAGLKENPAIATIDRAIDRDIDAQKLDIEKKRSAVSATGTLYGQMMEQFRDERTATEATRMMLLKTTEMKLQKIAAGTRSDEVRANAMQMLGQLRAEGAKAQAAVLEHMSTKFTIEQDTKPTDLGVARQRIANEVRENPQLKEYQMSREGLREFQIGMRSGNFGPGIIAFMRKGLDDPKFSHNIAELLNQNGIADKTIDGIKRALGRGTDSKFSQDLYTFLRAKEHSLRNELGPQFERLDREARQIGEPEGLHSFMATGVPDAGGMGNTSGMPASAKRVR